MTLAATLVLTFLPQVFPGKDLKLPPKAPAAEKATEEVRPLKEIERFRRDLLEMNGPKVKVLAKLEEMGHAYPKIEALILEVARKARATEMINLMPVARRYGRVSGTDRVADELMFQLLARPLSKATRVTLETMATLKGDKAKEALRQCLRASIPAVRRQAVAVFAPLADESDVPFAMALSREQKLDLQLRGLDLLQAIGTPEAVARMIELLSKKPALAAAACSALTKLGTAAVPALQERVKQPAIDRSYVYAAFALAQIGAAAGRDFLPDESFVPLQKRLQAPEALTRCLAAVPLSDLVYRSVATANGKYPDAKIVDALLLVVEPEQFVPNLDLLRAPAEQRLLRHTGRVAAAESSLTWRNWWDTQKSTFLGVRSTVEVNEGNVDRTIVTLRQQGQRIRVIGEGLADLRPIEDAIEILLTQEQMLAFVRELEEGGFGNEVAMHVDSALPRVRSIELQLPDGRTSAAVTEQPHFAFDNLVEVTRQCVNRELWQLYRIAEDEPNRAAYWRAERRWLAGNDDPFARSRRFVKRVFTHWSKWDEQAKVKAIGYVLSHPDRKQILQESHGELVIAALRKAPEMTPIDVRVLEVAATVPGDKVWRECVELAVSKPGGGNEAVRGVFKVLGPDAVLSALSDKNPTVRRAAIDEVVQVRDQRAAPRLIALLEDEDMSVKRGAVFAVGHLRVRAASKPLVTLLSDAEVTPQLRREGLRALGRVGGELAFTVLQSALQAPLQEDKQAALRGLGELRDPRAAHVLAEFVVIGRGQDIGELAKYHLQRQGGLRAVPALRGQLEMVTDEDTRAELVKLLGLYQDRKSVPDLMDLLRNPRHAREAASLLEGSTGVDLANATDRITLIESWWSAEKNSQQWQWLLAGLKQEQVQTTLEPDQFLQDADMMPVPELSRLLVDLEQPRLWVLTNAVLRAVAGQDFGIVTQQTPPDVREGIAGRYRVLAETERAAQKR